jgi:hypothetical protein
MIVMAPRISPDAIIAGVSVSGTVRFRFAYLVR